jgi:hypothetical protein
MREGTDKRGKPHFFVDYDEEWFDKKWMTFAIWGLRNCKRGHTYDRKFAQFQVIEDAQAFVDEFMNGDEKMKGLE